VSIHGHRYGLCHKATISAFGYMPSAGPIEARQVATIRLIWAAVGESVGLKMISNFFNEIAKNNTLKKRQEQ
jgi:hypothetical protein